MNALYSKPRKYLPLIFSAVCLLLLAACATTGGDSGGGGGSAPSGFVTQKLAYGVSIAIPADWQAQVHVDPATSKQNIDQRIASEKGVVLMIAAGPDTDGKGPEAAGRLAVLEYIPAFPPENVLLEATPEQFSQWSQNAMKQEADSLAKKKQPHSLDSLNISRAQIDGKNALLMRRKGSNPQGEKGVMIEAYIYLPNNKLAQVNLAGGTHVPGMETTLERILMSIKIADK